MVHLWGAYLSCNVNDVKPGLLLRNHQMLKNTFHHGRPIPCALFSKAIAILV